MIKEFKGECKGVRVFNRNFDNHLCVEILTDDRVSVGYFSSCWIDELIEQLKKAKEFLETQKPNIRNNTPTSETHKE
jgi:hypothetical protein